MLKPELLAPAGNLEKLKAAVDFGADAVYLGGKRMGLRAFADNFTEQEMQEGIEYAHKSGRKAYVTVNIFPHNRDLAGLEEYLVNLRDIGTDAIIVSDPGVIMTAKGTVPELDIHLSTQANCTNYKSALFWYNCGAKRLVMARELSLSDYKELRERLPKSCEIEAFVHGAMCISYSGRCLLSNYMTGRDANRGECAQPCRYKYYLMEEKRPGEYYQVFEDDSGSYILNSKDLCMIEYIPELICSGINSFKIEGRMKSAFYVASVVKAYRAAIDRYFERPESYMFDRKWMEYLTKPSHRPFTTGFYFDEEIKQHYDSSDYIQNYELVGVVKSYDKTTGTATVEQRNKVFKGDLVEILTLTGDNKVIKLENMRNPQGEEIDSTPHPLMIYTVKTDKELKNGDMIIKKMRE